MIGNENIEFSQETLWSVEHSNLNTYHSCCSELVCAPPSQAIRVSLRTNSWRPNKLYKQEKFQESHLEVFHTWMRLRFSFSQQEITSHIKKIHYTGIKRDVKKLPLIKRNYNWSTILKFRYYNSRKIGSGPSNSASQCSDNNLIKMNLAGFDINWIAMKAEIFSNTVTLKDDPFEDTDPRLVLRRNK